MSEKTATPQVKARFADAKFYQEVKAAAAEKFGEGSRAYETIMDGVFFGTGTGSNFFFTVEAGLHVPEGQRVATVDDIGRVIDAEKNLYKVDGPESGVFFNKWVSAYTPQLMLRGDYAKERRDAKILEHLVEQVKDRGFPIHWHDPLLLSGLELEGDESRNNPYGLLFKVTDDTKIAVDPRLNGGKMAIGDSVVSDLGYDTISSLLVDRSALSPHKRDDRNSGSFLVKAEKLGRPPLHSNHGRVILADAESGSQD